MHWGVALLILALAVLGWTAVSLPLSPLKLKLFFWHKSLGILVLLLATVRLAWRWIDAVPAAAQDSQPWERRVAVTVHGLLYLLLFAMPLSGWVINSAANFPFKVFGLWPLPPIVPKDSGLKELAEDTHLLLFWLLCGLLMLHVGAALWHHFVRRDRVLRRMLPRFLQRTRDPRSWLMVGVLCLAGLVVDPAQSAEWVARGPGSRLGFVATWEGNAVPGEFKRFSARVQFQPEKLAGEMRVAVDMSSVTTEIPDVDEALAQAEWFSVPRFPDAEFRAGQFRRLADGGFSAQGSLTLKGVQRPLAVPFRWEEGTEGVRMRGSLTINRSDFGIGSGEWSSGEVIGLEVSVEFDLRLSPAQES